MTESDSPQLESGICPASIAQSSTRSTMVPSQVELPKPQYYFEWMRKLRWRLFEAYNRLNFLVVLANVVVLVTFGACGKLKTMTFEALSIPVAANVAVTILIRNEIVVNLLFMFFGCFPQWLPLRIRRMAAKIYHLGGVHSGAAISALIWFAAFNGTFLIHWLETPSNNSDTAVLAITMVIDILLIAMIGFSWPKFRARFHNTWECIHRYSGWTAVILFWAHFGLLMRAKRNLGETSRPVIETLMRSPTFWLLSTTTLCIIWPWLRLRKVEVYAEPLSSHVIRLHFTYTNIAFCAAPRLSDNPLLEWHSFAGIPEESGFGYSVIISRAGDWTDKIIKHPPTKLWIKSIPVRGVLHIAPLFKKMILVATGSGIGPVLSLLYARKVGCRILWSTQDPEKTYQEEVVTQVKKADPQAVIINTSIFGRPNLCIEAYKLYQEYDAEAVFVISNPKVTVKTVYELESRGIPTFAPIFDS